MIEFIVGILVGALIGGYVVFKMYDNAFHNEIQKKFEGNN